MEYFTANRAELPRAKSHGGLRERAQRTATVKPKNTLVFGRSGARASRNSPVRHR